MNLEYQLFRMRRTSAGGLREFLVQALTENEAKEMLLAHDNGTHYHCVEVLGRVGSGIYTMPVFSKGETNR